MKQVELTESGCEVAAALAQALAAHKFPGNLRGNYHNAMAWLAERQPLPGGLGVNEAAILLAAAAVVAADAGLDPQGAL